MSKKNVEWEWKKLKDICNINFGTRVVRKKDGGSIYPVYGGGGATFMMDSYNREDCLVVSRFAMSQQCTRFVSGKFFLNDSGLSLSPKDNSLTESFLNTTILGLNDDIYALGRGTAQKNLNVDAFKELMLPIPPLDEQERIVKVLDDAFEKIDTIKTTAETNLQNAKDLFQTTLKKLFSEISKDNHELLKNVAIDFSRGKSKHRPRNDKKLFGGNYPFIQTGDIRNSGKYLIEYTDTYNEFGLSQSKLWPKGTLCITIAANIAETTILTIPCCFPDSVIGFIPNENRTTVDYVFYVLQFFKSELQILGKGAAQDNLNLATFEKMTFPFPPLPIQKQIVAKLDSLSEKVKQLESNYKQVLVDCDELKKALLKQAFEGML